MGHLVVVTARIHFKSPKNWHGGQPRFSLIGCSCESVRSGERIPDHELSLPDCLFICLVWSKKDENRSSNRGCMALSHGAC
jgi:hypothetical protein